MIPLFDVYEKYAVALGHRQARHIITMVSQNYIKVEPIDLLLPTFLNNKKLFYSIIRHIF